VYGCVCVCVCVFCLCVGVCVSVFITCIRRIPDSVIFMYLQVFPPIIAFWASGASYPRTALWNRCVVNYRFLTLLLFFIETWSPHSLLSLSFVNLIILADFKKLWPRPADQKYKHAIISLATSQGQFVCLNSNVFLLDWCSLCISTSACQCTSAMFDGHLNTLADGKHVLAGTSDGQLQWHPLLDIMLEIFDSPLALASGSESSSVPAPWNWQESSHVLSLSKA
jgi:hypothetical protein